MASTSSPYGLRPINLLGGQGFAGSTRLYPIASNYSVSMQYGDPVVLLAGGSTVGGVVNRFAAIASGTATASATLLGVFVGCTYTDPVYGKVFRQNYPGSIVAADIQAYIVDDPDTLFQAQFNNTATVTRNFLGANCGLIQTVEGSSSANINSGVSLNSNVVAATATLPIRVVDFVSLGDAFPDAIVRINTHFMRTATGNAIT